MWIATRLGFFSIVQKPEDKVTGSLTIRARVRSDLEQLRDEFLPGMQEIVENAGTDYRFRGRAPKEDVAGALSKLVLDLDYSNFKDEIYKKQGKHRASVYGKVWQALYSLQDVEKLNPKPAATKAPNGKKMAYGGVLVDDEGRILLRRPTGDYDGYVWTFPKGRPDHGDTEEQAALREVKEETGYAARIIGSLGGVFDGGTTVTKFFVMSPSGKASKFIDETSEIKWVAPEGASELISMTTNLTGRKRDLAVLEAVRAYLKA